ncbi:hypothetical protein BJY00DRAFT_74154 [Aspergillus carlsbadensis]|nr:hypothetical protein BJY00DRAFT_74154 [Aspergillus carlsbadensis]
MDSENTITDDKQRKPGKRRSGISSFILPSDSKRLACLLVTHTCTPHLSTQATGRMLMLVRHLRACSFHLTSFCRSATLNYSACCICAHLVAGCARQAGGVTFRLETNFIPLRPAQLPVSSSRDFATSLPSVSPAYGHNSRVDFGTSWGQLSGDRRICSKRPTISKLILPDGP